MNLDMSPKKSQHSARNIYAHTHTNTHKKLKGSKALIRVRSSPVDQPGWLNHFFLLLFPELTGAKLIKWHIVHIWAAYKYLRIYIFVCVCLLYYLSSRSWCREMPATVVTDEDSRLPAWFSEMCHESLTYLRRRDQFESINTLNKQASTLARPTCNNAVANLGPASLIYSLWWLVTSTPGTPLPFLPFCIVFNSPSALTQTITSEWKHCSTPAVLQKQRQPPSLPRVVCPTFAEAIISSIHFFLQPAVILGLCQINWGHPLILIQPSVLAVKLPPPNCTLEKKRKRKKQQKTSNFPGVFVQRQRIYP